MRIRDAIAWPSFKDTIRICRMEYDSAAGKPRRQSASRLTLYVAYGLAAEYLNERNCAANPGVTVRLIVATDIALLFEKDVPNTVPEVLQILGEISG